MTKILICSVSASLCKSLKDWLEGRGGYQVAIAGDLNLGAIHVNKDAPEVILLHGAKRLIADDPIAFIRVVKRARPEIRVIFISDVDGDCKDAAGAGANVCVMRPDLLTMERWFLGLEVVLERRNP